MARTKIALIGAEFSSKRTFAGIDSNIFLNFTSLNKISFNTRTLRIPENGFEDHRLLDIAKRDVEANPKRYHYGVLEKASAMLLGEKYPNYSARLLKSIEGFIRPPYYYESSYEGDDRLLSVLLLNEFLAQTKVNSYGEFIEESWDAIYDSLATWKFNEYSWTADLFDENRDPGVLTFRPNMPKIARKEIESLTLEEIQFIRSQANLKESLGAAAARKRLKTYLAIKNGESRVRAEPSYVVLNTMVQAFNETLAKLPGSTNLDFLKIYRSYVLALEEAKIALTADQTKTSATQLFTGDVLSYGKFLLKHAAEFSPAEMFFAGLAWQEIKNVSRSGSKADMMKFLIGVIERFKDDEEKAVTIFKLIGDAGANYQGQLPTMSQWNKGLAQGMLDDIIDTEITLILLSGTDAPGERLVRVMQFRKAFDPVKES